MQQSPQATRSEPGAMNQPSSELFHECVREIETAYEALGYRLGWRFLNVSRRVLEGPVHVALITINPAGDHIPTNHPWSSCEKGVSYLVERWAGAAPGQSKLQVQVQSLFRLLKRNLAFPGSYQELMAQSLISQFIPFRSPRFDQLPRQREALDFGRRIWMRILPTSSPRLIICLGRDVQAELRALIPLAMEAVKRATISFATGWGNYTAEIDEYRTSVGIVRLLYLPHLSTFQIFTSQKCIPYTEEIVKSFCKEILISQ